MSQESAKVHIVEDDEAVRESLQMVLESVGYKVAAYDSANRFIDDWSPDMAR